MTISIGINNQKCVGVNPPYPGSGDLLVEELTQTFLLEIAGQAFLGLLERIRFLQRTPDVAEFDVAVGRDSVDHLLQETSHQLAQTRG